MGGSHQVKGWLGLGKEMSWKNRRLASESGMHKTEIMEGLQLCVVIIMG